MKHNQGLALFLFASLFVAGVSCHTVVWCLGRDGNLNDVVAMGSYHSSSEAGWNSATTVISTSNGEPWGPSMSLSGWIVEPSPTTANSIYFGCGFSCTDYCSTYSLSGIRTWQVKILPPNTFTEGITYGITQSSTELVDAPLCAIPGGGATFPILPPLGTNSITCPGDQTITQTSSCQAVATWANPSCTAACPSSVCGSTRNGPASGSNFPAGTTTIVYDLTVDTIATGISCSFDIIVEDNTDPSFATACPADQTFCGPGPQPFTWTPPTFTDCNTPTVVSSHNPGDSFNTGTTTVTYVADDGHGNSLTCSFDITVYSNPPTIACPSDFTVGASSATPGSPGGSSSSFTASYTIIGTDSCGNSLGTNQLAGASGPPATISYDQLPMTFTYETDPDPVNGQQPTCTFTVSGAYAQLASVSQPAGLYRFGDVSNPPPANVGELGLYIPTVLCWQLVNTPAAGDVGTLVIHDGTNVIHTFVTADEGATTFPLDAPGSCMEFLGPHQVNIGGEYYLGVMNTNTALANNWPAFELHAIIDWY